MCRPIYRCMYRDRGMITYMNTDMWVDMPITCLVVWQSLHPMFLSILF